MRLALALVLFLLTASAASAAEFKLGFKALADQIPEIAGTPLEEERYGPNGDSLQQTTTGLMVWRKSDNKTLFTDGSRSWVNGPLGLQSRLNTDRFDWEAPDAFTVGYRVTGYGMAFTVNSVVKVSQLNLPVRDEPQQGKVFMVVDVTVENVERDRLNYGDSNYKTKDASGYVYSTDIDTWVIDGGFPVNGTLSRGDKVRGKLVFQVPQDSSGLVLIYRPEFSGAGQIVVALD